MPTAQSADINTCGKCFIEVHDSEGELLREREREGEGLRPQMPPAHQEPAPPREPANGLGFCTADASAASETHEQERALRTRA